MPPDPPNELNPNDLKAVAEGHQAVSDAKGVSAEQSTKLTAAEWALYDSHNNLNRASKEQIELFQKLNQESERLSQQQLKAAEDGGFLKTIMDGVGVVANALSSAINNLGDKFESSDSKAKMATAGLAALSTQAFVAKNILNELGEGTTISSKSAHDFSDNLNSLEKTLGILGKIPAGFLDHFGKFYSATENVQKFENNLISLNARFAGFETAGDRLKFINELDKNLHDFTATNVNLANSMGLSVEEVTKYTSKLMELPGLYRSIVDYTDRGGDRMLALEAATRVARGTTGNFEDAFKNLNQQFRDFGDRDGRVAIDNLAKTYELSQDLGISFEDTRKPIQEITNDFKAMGNQTEGATNLVNGLGRSLLEIKGVGVETMTNIVKEVGANIEHMNIAQKAFLSAQTGGSGGLKGAFEIDLLLREGKMDEVYQKMETALRSQFGGRIVGLQEAASNQEAAGQMTKQLAFMREGPFGGVVKSDAEAYRLLEAMQAGTRPTAGKFDTATKDAFEADSKQQDRQHLALTNIANNTQQMAQDLNIMNARAMRGFAGGGMGETGELTPFGTNLQTDRKSFRANAIKPEEWRGISPAVGEDIKTIAERPGLPGTNMWGDMIGNAKQQMENMSVPGAYENLPKMPALRDARTGAKSQGNEMVITNKFELTLKDGVSGANIPVDIKNTSDVNESRMNVGQ